MSDVKKVNEEDYKEFECVDCSTNTLTIQEYYMVQFDLWLSVMESLDSGMLCLGCLEKRIDRALVPDDFIDAPINYGVFGMSDRFKDRIGNKFN